MNKKKTNYNYLPFKSFACYNNKDEVKYQLII